MIHDLRSVAAAGVAAFLASSFAVAGPAPSLADREKALLARPDSAAAASELGQAYRAESQAARGVAFLERFHEKNPPNPMSLVWQGSLKAFLSSTGEDMEARLTLLEGGIADMDRAVRLFPDDPKVRVVRGVTVSYFPTFLAMHNKAIRDLEDALANPAIGEGVRAAAREGLARAYRQAGRVADAEALESGKAR